MALDSISIAMLGVRSRAVNSISLATLGIWYPDDDLDPPDPALLSRSKRMTQFVTNWSLALSIGNTADTISLPAPIHPTGSPQPDAKVRRGRHFRVINTHATQIMYGSQSAVPTSSSYEFTVAPGREAIIPIRENSGSLRMIASGATTTGTLEVGDLL